MRADIQDIFKQTPHDKQVMMFSATLSQEMRLVCKKFMSNVRSGSVATGVGQCYSGATWRTLSPPSFAPLVPAAA